MVFLILRAHSPLSHNSLHICRSRWRLWRTRRGTSSQPSYCSVSTDSRLKISFFSAKLKICNYVWNPGYIGYLILTKRMSAESLRHLLAGATLAVLLGPPGWSFSCNFYLQATGCVTIVRMWSQVLHRWAGEVFWPWQWRNNHQWHPTNHGNPGNTRK